MEPHTYGQPIFDAAMDTSAPADPETVAPPPTLPLTALLLLFLPLLLLLPDDVLLFRFVPVLPELFFGFDFAFPL